MKQFFKHVIGPFAVVGSKGDRTRLSVVKAAGIVNETSRGYPFRKLSDSIASTRNLWSIVNLFSSVWCSVRDASTQAACEGKKIEKNVRIPLCVSSRLCKRASWKKTTDDRKRRRWKEKQRISIMPNILHAPPSNWISSMAIDSLSGFRTIRYILLVVKPSRILKVSPLVGCGQWIRTQGC